MKIILVGLVLLIAWKAGLALLVPLCLGALLLTYLGIENIQRKRISGEGKVIWGVWTGIAALLATLLKLAVLFLAWTSLTTVFPGIVPWVKSVLAWIASL